jgi:pimeloyl-ACP methyl ester carboxylesterase
MFGTTHSFALEDGRTLAFAVYGLPLNSHQDPAHVILYHHGWPSSRLEGVYWEDAVQTQQMRLIAVDRPGIGKSSFCKCKSKLEEWQLYSVPHQALLGKVAWGQVELLPIAHPYRGKVRHAPGAE